MDFEPYLPLIRKMAKMQFDFGVKVGELCQNPSHFEKIFQSVMDETIDPGDFEDATERFMQFFQDIPEYCDMIEFNIQNRKELTKLNLVLANAGESDYIKYTEILQRTSVEMAVEMVFDLLRKQGVVKDKH